MKGMRFLGFVLMVCFFLVLLSCDNKERAFYNNLKANDDCMIACDVVYNGKERITVVMEKHFLTHIFDQSNQPIDDQILINSIKSNEPIEVSKPLYDEFYTMHVINQHRVDSLLGEDINNFYFYNHNNDKLLNPSALENITIMEEMYLMKRLFDQKVLLKRDCESGYYYEIK